MNRLLEILTSVPKFQGNLPVKHCNRCATELIVGETWGAGNERACNYMCNSCEQKISRYNRLKRLARMVSRSVMKQYDTAKDGYVYIISNKAWEFWYKIGMAIDAEDRLNSYQTSDPYRNYVLEYSKYFSNRRNAEAIAHKNIGRISVKRKGEWFYLNLGDAKKIIEEIVDEANT